MLTVTLNRHVADVLATSTLVLVAAATGLGAPARAAEAQLADTQDSLSPAPSAMSRRVYGAAQAAQNLVQTVVWDPFVCQ